MNHASLPDFWAVLAPLTVAAAMAATYALTVLLRPLLLRVALVHPNTRSSHKTPTPEGGGIAVAIVTIVVTVLVASFVATDAQMKELSTVLGAAALLAMVGSIDDVWSIPAVPRLLVQALAVAAVTAVFPAELRIFPLLPFWFERALVVLTGVWFVNAVNFMDGIDWMTVAEAVPISAGLVLLGALGVLPAHATVTALALGGALLGFAPFNRPVARLFLGDVGSLPIGLLLGWLLLWVAGSGHVAAALLLPLYYLADATLTLLHRWRSGQMLSEAHRSHYYQRATAGGFTVWEVVTRVFAVNLGLAALATVTVLRPGGASGVVCLILGGVLVGWLLVAFARGKR
jgi:UDP-N-acetylmuramyl pentapeptide phosphotransferase/UDP-N-acetylglucosamine-1-phosphate transferase